MGDYPQGPAAELSRARDPVAMILVEGVSDQIAVEALATGLGHDLTGERVAVVPVGGVGGTARVLAENTSAVMRLVALCDAGEQDIVHRAIAASGRTVSLFVCEPDLEAELIRAVGIDAALAVVECHGDLGSFRTLQKQTHWRDRAPEAQLRRFIGAGARRKLRYALLLTEAAVDVDRVPDPLAAALGAAVEVVREDR